MNNLYHLSLAADICCQAETSNAINNLVEISSSKPNNISPTEKLKNNLFQCHNSHEFCSSNTK